MTNTTERTSLMNTFLRAFCCLLMAFQLDSVSTATLAQPAGQQPDLKSCNGVHSVECRKELSGLIESSLEEIHSNIHASAVGDDAKILAYDSPKFSMEQNHAAVKEVVLKDYKEMACSVGFEKVVIEDSQAQPIIREEIDLNCEQSPHDDAQNQSSFPRQSPDSGALPRMAQGSPKLTRQEKQELKRQQAFEARAKKLCEIYNDWSVDQCRVVADHRIGVGMTYDMVVESWGRPAIINRGTSADGVTDHWIYQRSHCESTTYFPYFHCWPETYADVYFENGLLTSIDQQR